MRDTTYLLETRRIHFSEIVPVGDAVAVKFFFEIRLLLLLRGGILGRRQAQAALGMHDTRLRPRAVAGFKALYYAGNASAD